MRENLHTVAPFYMLLMTHPWEQRSSSDKYIHTAPAPPLSIPACARPFYFLFNYAWFPVINVRQTETDPPCSLIACALEITWWCILSNRLWQIPKTSTGAAVKCLTWPFLLFLKQAGVMCWQMSMAWGRSEWSMFYQMQKKKKGFIKKRKVKYLRKKKFMKTLSFNDLNQ